MIRTHVEEVMTTEVSTVDEEVSVQNAAERLHDNDIGSLVVLRNDAPVGIFTESDLVQAVAMDRDLTDTLVSEYMSQPIVTIEADALVQDAARKMCRNNIKKLPVMNDGELAGIVTTTDLSDYIPRSQLTE